MDQPGAPSNESKNPKSSGLAIAAHVISGLLCLFGVLTLAAIALVNLLVVPKFIKIFDDFDTDMPAITIMMIELRYAMIAGAALLAVVLLIKEFLIPNPMAKGLINLCAGVLTLLCGAVLIFGMWMPLVALMRSVM